MFTSTGRGTPRRAATITRRAGLALGLAAMASAGAVAAGASPALADPPQNPCVEERAYVYQSVHGEIIGPYIDSRFNPGEFNISNSATEVRSVFAAGIHRPRRKITFRFVNQDNATVKTYPTTESDNNGIVRQEANVFKYDFTQVGWKVRVYADIRSRCGGDDVARTLYVGTINTTA